MSVLLADRVHIAQETAHLIEQCLQGDQAAYASLYRTHAADVYRLVYGLLGHREDTEEVVQDAFVYAMRNLARYDSNRASFRTWLFTIATSRARNKRRRRWLPTISIRQLLQFGAELPTPDEPARPPETSVEEARRREVVREAVSSLSPKLCEAAVLRYFEGLTYKEIGQILGIPHKTAESRVRLAHQELKKLVGEIG